MKNESKFFFLSLFMIISFGFTGCYTEFAAQETNSDEYYADSDTSYDENGNVTINNNYYLDDDYRQSRFRLSFNYYYPTYHHSLLASYYYSYYDDPYWGWGSPYDYYDPWRYGCVYWPPILDPWYPYPYYPGMVHYPIYYPSYPIYVDNSPRLPQRIRDNGATRDPRDPNIRTRPISVSSPVSPRVTDETTPRIRTRSEAEQVDGQRIRERNTERRTDSQNVRPTERRRNEREIKNPSGSRNPESKSVERRRQSSPTYSSPPQRTGTRQTRPVERPRENRQPSYNPPSQSSPSNSPRVNNGNNSGGRRRN